MKVKVKFFINMEAFLTFIGGCIILIFLVVVIMSLSRWAVNDATDRGSNAFFVWVFVVCGFPLGWITWLLVRGPLKGQRKSYRKSKPVSDVSGTPWENDPGHM